MFRLAMVLGFVFSFSGCEIVKHEAYTVGGYPASVADQRLKAVTFQQHVDRYRTAFSFFSVVAMSSAYSGESAEDTARDVGRAFASLETLEDALKVCGFDRIPPGGSGSFCNDVTVSNVKESSLAFETLSVQMQRELADLVARAARNLGARLELDKLDASSATTIARWLFDLRSNLPAVRNAFGAFRDMTHIFVRSVAVTCAARRTTGKCDDLINEFHALYANTHSGDPLRVRDRSEEKRLKALLELSAKAIEENISESFEYWDPGRDAADSYIKAKCRAVLGDFGKSGSIALCP
ncbi:hypothetical protein [Shimia sp.]|uniref:hypothetical protein n=1 Tax=Shimia sp. TaxID=1954381 RepID=UPI003BAA2399